MLFCHPRRPQTKQHARVKMHKHTGGTAFELESDSLVGVRISGAERSRDNMFRKRSQAKQVLAYTQSHNINKHGTAVRAGVSAPSTYNPRASNAPFTPFGFKPTSPASRRQVHNKVC